jgi:hypothetical protein
MATWDIVILERNVADGGVITAHWSATDVDGEHTVETRGSVNFTPNPSDSGFIPYANLTKANVIGWVKAQEDVTAIESSLTANIAELQSPTTADGVPW